MNESSNYKFLYLDKESNNKYLGEVKNNRLIKYINLNKKILGNIYRGRVLKYIDSLDAYIVDIGLDKDALLRKKNTIENVKNSDEILIELIKNPDNEKMYEISQKITLSNSHIVLNPYIKNKKNFKDKKYNYFLRSKAKNLDKNILNKKYEELELIFEKILYEKNKLPTPKLIYENNFEKEFFEDYKFNKISNISLSGFEFIDDFNPNYNKIISLDLKKSREKYIETKGISIVVEKTEALNIIDINSRNSYQNINKEEMSLRVNIDSLEEIAVQISLRNLKKMMIIDFLRMENKNKKIFLNKLIEVFEYYNLKYKIMGFSNMGFLELIIY